MQLCKCASLVLAEKVVKVVRTIWPKHWEGWIDVWANGREQGLSICAYGKKSVRANVAQTRAGELILVVVGRQKDFDGRTNNPNKRAWGLRQVFEPGEYSEAAAYILEEISAIFVLHEYAPKKQSVASA